MPELPEVETVRRGLIEPLVGRRFESAWAFDHAKFRPATDAAPAEVTGVGRRGKYLLVGLDARRELVIHLGMTGVLSFAGPDDVLPGHVRALWTLDDGRRLVFDDVRRFGRILVVDEGSYDGIATLSALGPEPLEDPDPVAFHRALAAGRAQVKTKLLSQRPIAGVGNIYADEALWTARIHPGARRLGRDRSDRLLEAIVEALRAGVENGGTTLRDYRTVDGGTGTHQDRLRCYGRAGAPCDRCSTTLRRTVVDGRGTTYCPSCQRH